jgi:tetratricopeptide (TPR) repeat protein
MTRIILTIALLAFLAGCGGDSDKEKAAKERYRKAVATYRTDLKQWKKDQVEADECAASMKDFRDAIKELDGRLDIGLSYDEYSTQVGDVSAAYSQSDFDAGGFDCISRVGLPLEEALNAYRKAYQAWNKCFEDYACEVDSIDPQLQKHWTRASDQIQRSDDALDELQVGPRPQPPPKPAALQE